ncbi:GNAT family N-acetyltransferase [Metabacillus sediminilitoris]|uniref:GNAT family N-acetyltransferase n=1 Tax=Metabacillus sediminilitoris TaxID=2567941 RepID=A0A4V6RXP4_9BACI|nr:GNAT family N-acetyltransferase [Metabacillus sediminilitoris]QGQ46764.1 GNAT family N-acetyltransferase [Metabacillus sediminilitoris]THF82913.1 GNAT family N-acetyltransferase [Metabacillus sediminilitoris]
MYRKELYLFNNGIPIKTIFRQYTERDFDQLIAIQKESFPPPFPSKLWWNTEQLQNHVSLFPEGAICAEIEGKIVGSMTSLIIDYHPNDSKHSWEEATDDGYIRSHLPTGNSLYVVDICVAPAYRKLGVGKWLMQSMYEIVVSLNLDRLIGGGRIPGYHKVSNSLSVDDYVQNVLSGKLKDPVMSFLLHCGRTPVCPVENYLEDEESCHYGILMEWKNPFKQKNECLR